MFKNYLNKNSDLIRQLVNSHKKNRITLPRHNHQYGHPVIFDQAYFSNLKKLKGDIGARHILNRNIDALNIIDEPTGACIFDIDH